MNQFILIMSLMLASLAHARAAKIVKPLSGNPAITASEPDNRALNQHIKNSINPDTNDEEKAADIRARYLNFLYAKVPKISDLRLNQDWACLNVVGGGNEPVDLTFQRNLRFAIQDEQIVNFFAKSQTWTLENSSLTMLEPNAFIRTIRVMGNGNLIIEVAALTPVRVNLINSSVGFGVLWYSLCVPPLIL